MVRSNTNEKDPNARTAALKKKWAPPPVGTGYQPCGAVRWVTARRGGGRGCRRGGQSARCWAGAAATGCCTSCSSPPRAVVRKGGGRGSPCPSQQLLVSTTDTFSKAQNVPKLVLPSCWKNITSKHFISSTDFVPKTKKDAVEKILLPGCLFAFNHHFATLI